jgi:hypothetical protein
VTWAIEIDQNEYKLDSENIEIGVNHCVMAQWGVTRAHLKMSKIQYSMVIISKSLQ